MTNHTSSISLGDLSAAGVRLRHSEAVAVVREVALRAARGDLPGIPAPESIRLISDGSISVEGPVAAGGEVHRAARLLTALLSDVTAELSAPATFRLIVARAFANDEAAYGSLEQFTDALAPFAAPDPAAAVRELVATSYAARALMESDEMPGIDRTSTAPHSEPLTPIPAAATQVEHSTEVADLNAQTADPLAIEEFDTKDARPAAGYAGLRPARDRRRSASLVRERQSTTSVARRSVWGAGAAGVAIAALFALLLTTSWRSRDEARPTDARAVPAAGTSGLPAALPTGEAPVRPLTRPATPVAASAETTPRQSAPVPAATIVSSPAGHTPGPTRMLPDVAFSPAFATAASAMFYHSGTGPGSAIMRADTDSRGAVVRVTRLVNDRASNFHPRPSPDGQTIAFDSDRDGERGVYVADKDGHGVRRVSGSGFASVPSWSPDGRRLAYVRAETGRPRVWNIWTVDVGSGETSRITSHRVGQPWGAAWFPGGGRIAYSHEDRLIVQSLDGGDVRRFSSPVRGRLVRTPAVSPDGKRIIFQVRHSGAWMLDLTSDTMRRVLEDPTADEFTWSPDGRRVAYHSRRAGTWGVWVMSPR